MGSREVTHKGYVGPSGVARANDGGPTCLVSYCITQPAGLAIGIAAPDGESLLFVTQNDFRGKFRQIQEMLRKEKNDKPNGWNMAAPL